jgi:hypothetical protein
LRQRSPALHQHAMLPSHAPEAYPEELLRQGHELAQRQANNCNACDCLQRLQAKHAHIREDSTSQKCRNHGHLLDTAVSPGAQQHSMPSPSAHNLTFPAMCTGQESAGQVIGTPKQHRTFKVPQPQQAVGPCPECSFVHSDGTLLPRLMYSAGTSRNAVPKKTATHSAMPPTVSLPPHGTSHRWLYAPQFSRPHLRSAPCWRGEGCHSPRLSGLW